MISTSSVDVKKGRIYMSINISAVETVNALKAIFIKHQSERICVIGTTCCGKTKCVTLTTSSDNLAMQATAKAIGMRRILKE